ncbi:KR domain-containing protein [Priestia megaterium]
MGAEYQKVNSRTIDIDLPLEDIEGIRKIIFNEIGIGNSNSEVCYRKGNRYIPYMKEVENIDTSFQNIWSDLIESDKVLVITGGTRGIGAEIAKYMVAKQVKKLVLMGKRVSSSQ